MDEVWQRRIEKAVVLVGTPCFIYASQPVDAALQELSGLRGRLPIRHWYSMKTAAVRPMIQYWLRKRQGIEVVSPFELAAAITEGFSPENILVNGVAKHAWLPEFRVPGLKVQFDSLKECADLSSVARDRQWQIGLRVQGEAEYDPDDSTFKGQFGLNRPELEDALRIINSYNLRLNSISFHLRSNVSTLNDYSRSIRSLAQVCSELKLQPSAIDCGGGLPVPGERSRLTGETTWTFELAQFKQVLDEIADLFPSVEEVWLENGRFLTARAAVFVCQVLDVKEHQDARYLICDGGRTNHALASDWQWHDLFSVPMRSGERILTSVCGPTCMAYDWITRELLPGDITIGDLIVWPNAGAYHTSWETRFSYGLSPVVWLVDEDAPLLVRRRETYKEWWDIWDAARNLP
jgi:diaminopimelate decarboxylase